MIYNIFNIIDVEKYIFINCNNKFGIFIRFK